MILLIGKWRTQKIERMIGGCVMGTTREPKLLPKAPPKN